MACCLLLVPCALLSIVCPLSSRYPIIVSVASPVSPSLPSFVSLFSLLVSVVLCWSVVFRCVLVMLTVQTVLCLPVCPPSGWFLLLCLILLLNTHFSCTWVLTSSLSSCILAATSYPAKSCFLYNSTFWNGLFSKCACVGRVKEFRKFLLALPQLSKVVYILFRPY